VGNEPLRKKDMYVSINLIDVVEMEQKLEIEPSEELAYWVGVLQSDGCLTTRNYRDRKSQKIVKVEVAPKSLEMVKKFSQLSELLFTRKAKIFKLSSGKFKFSIGASQLIEIFEKLDIDAKDPPRPPFWVLDNYPKFGAYLAGLIDGDGDIRIKRPEYPQCALRITSGGVQTSLKKAIKELLKCGVSITYRSGTSMLDGRKIEGKWYDLEFVVSRKTRDFLEKFVLPKMTIKHKVQKLSEFLSNN